MAARRPEGEQEEDLPEEEGEVELGTREDLERAGDVEGLLLLARAFRGGLHGQPKDLRRCYETYATAAKLGSPEAEYALALFHLAGGVVPQDLKEGAAHLRAAADGGFVEAKVYLANLYELGVHYGADADKADVWYRSAARSAGVTDAPDSPGYARALAEMGSVRHAVLLADDPTVSTEERELYLRRARAHGQGLKTRPSISEVVPSGTPPPMVMTVGDAPPSTSGPMPAPGARGKATAARADEAEADAPEGEEARAKPAARKAPAKKKAPAPSRFTTRAGLTAFGYMILFVGAGLGAAKLAAEGAKLLARSGPLPVFGTHLELVYPAVAALIGFVPALLMYRFRPWLTAVVVSLAAAFAGYALHGEPHLTLVPYAVVQGVAAGAAAFLAALLVVGVTGGTKSSTR